MINSAILLSLAVLIAPMVAAAQGQTGFIHGVVLDPAEAVIVGMAIDISSADHSCKVSTDSEGKFNCQLPPGKYRVLASAQGWMPYRRATVTVKPSSHVFLKLRPIIIAAPIIDSVGPVSIDQRNFRDPDIHYKEEVLADGSDVLVRHISSTEKDGKIVFRGPHLMLSLDAIAVYADEVSCSNPIRTCTAQGSVIVEVGQEQLDGTGVDLDLVRRRLELTRDASVVRAF